MTKLIEPLEKLVKSDLVLSLLGNKEIDSLKVGHGPIGKKTQRRGYHTESGMYGYHIGSDQGTLNFSYTPGRVHGGLPLEDMMTFHDLGFTLIALKSGEIYAIHHDSNSFPRDITFQEISGREYLDRLRELCAQ